MDVTRRTAVGWAEASQLFGLAESATGTWLGAPVDATSLVLTHAYYGDANLDGKVNADDYALLDRGYAMGGQATWTSGDFDYDGAVTRADYLLIDRTYALLGNPFSPTLLASREATFGGGYVVDLLSSVPEPSSVITAALTLGASARRYRRR